MTIIPSIEENKYIFISGLHRSGTTLLHDIIAKNENVSAFANTGVPMNEGQFLQSVFPKVEGGPGKFGFFETSQLTEHSDKFLTKENKLKLINEWHGYWKNNHKVYLEKSPPNILKTRFLQEIFPNSYFITITRHPIAVSYATKKWSKTSVIDLFNHWLTVHKIYFSERSYLKNEILIKYEDIISPKNDVVFEKIENFLSFKLSTDNLNIKNANHKYFLKWEKPSIFLNRKKIINQFESEFNVFGYSLLQY